MLDLTSFDAALKVRYPQEMLENMVYKENPFLALVPKFEDFRGKNMTFPTIYGDPQGRSKTFSNAQTRGAATSLLVTDWTITRAKDYSICTIDNETLEASKGDANAFLSAVEGEMDGAIHALSRSLAVNMYRTTDAYIGQVLAEPSETSGTFSFTMKNVSDIANIEVGQMLVIYSAASGGSQRNSDGSDVNWLVAGVNRLTGVVTLTGTYNSSGTIAADDFIFVEGDRGLGIAGLESWLPTTAPSSALFFGVDRSVDTRLGGLRLDASSLPIEEALIEADSYVAREGYALDHYFINPTKFADLKKALGSKVQYVDLSANAKVSFRGVLVDGQRGPIKVVPDHNCQSNRIWGLKMDMWKFASIGKAVRPIDTDGLTMLRLASSDGVEVRFGFYGNLVCKGPGANINVQV